MTSRASTTTTRTRLSRHGGRLALGAAIATVAVLVPAGAAAMVGSHHDALTAGVVAYRSAGTLRFLGSAPGAPIARPVGLTRSASPAAVARTFLARRAHAFGIRAHARDLRVSSVRTLATGRAVVRLQQFRNGVPELGGELVVNLDRDWNVLSAGGETMGRVRVTVVPTVSPAAARTAAIAVTARTYGIAAGSLRTTRPRLWVYDPEILGRIGQPGLIWRVDVTGEDGGGIPVDELVLVDARIGLVALHFDQVATARYRRVCDAHNTSTQAPCRRPAGREGGWASTVRDVNKAYTYSGDTYDFYRGRFGRDSLDDAGMTLTSTVRYCDARVQHCRRTPWKNAQWDPELQQMLFGRGYASADDVVGHELTHGVIDHTSRLFYYYQSGAINESLADVFGEFVDLTNGRGTDTRASRWRLGEDLPGGAVRDMRNPPRYGQPDRMTSASYDMDRHEDDNGGVHANSGVGNKAAFLITAGGTFRGRAVRGLGIVKAASIYYEVMTNLLTSGSDYADLALALPQACANLVGSSEGITSADCDQVTAAVSAVDMAAEPYGTSHAPFCPAGQRPRDLFFDDLENPASGNWSAAASGNDWHYPPGDTPHGDATYATSGTMNFFAYGSAGSASITMTHSVRIPAGVASYLHFNHAYDFAEAGVYAYGGGLVVVSTDEGRTWYDAGHLLLENGYNGAVTRGYGRPFRAFVRQSNGYISTRAGLASLAGESVRLGFVITTEAPEWVAGDDGWFVDDIRIYSCVR